MTDETQDPRELLARMEAERDAALEKAQKAQDEYEARSKELKAKLRADDLNDVIAKCKLHGFTATDLRGALKAKGGARKTVARKSTSRTTSRRKSSKSA